MEVYLFFLREIGTISREETLSRLFCFSSEKESILTEREGSKSFPVRVSPFSKALACRNAKGKS